MKKIHKKFFGILLCAVLILTAIPMYAFALPSTGREEDYIYVNAVKVTHENASDVLSDGTVSYDEETNTLTLNNANLTVSKSLGSGESSHIIVTDGSLNINLVGKSTITTDRTTRTTGIYTDGDLSVSGSGELEILMCSGGFPTHESYGITTEHLTVSKAKLTVKPADSSNIRENLIETSFGIGAYRGMEVKDGAVIESVGAKVKPGFNHESTGIYVSQGDFVIENATVTATGGEAGNLSDSGEITTEEAIVASYGVCCYNGSVKVTENGKLDATGSKAIGNYPFSIGIAITEGDLEINNGTVYAESSDVKSDLNSTSNAIDIEIGNFIVDGYSSVVYAKTGKSESVKKAYNTAVNVLAGDIYIKAGYVEAVAGESIGGEKTVNYALRSRSDTHSDDCVDGKINITCDEIKVDEKNISRNFLATKVVLKAPNGIAVYAENEITVSDNLTFVKPEDCSFDTDKTTVLNSEGNSATEVEIAPLTYTVRVKGLSATLAIPVPAGKSLNEVYCSVLGVDDFSEYLNAHKKTGFLIDGWYTDSDCTAGNEYDFNSKVTEDITVYGTWKDELFINVTQTQGGNTSVDKTSTVCGKKVTITAQPDENKEVDKVSVLDAAGNAVAVTQNSDGTYLFVQPATDVTVSVTYKDKPVTPIDNNNGSNSNVDIPKTGGNSDVSLYLVMMLVSGVCALAVITNTKRKRTN